MTAHQLEAWVLDNGLAVNAEPGMLMPTQLAIDLADALCRWVMRTARCPATHPGSMTVTATRSDEYNTLVWNWKVGDVLEMHGGRGRWRIVKIGGLDESDDSSGKYQAA